MGRIYSPIVEMADKNVKEERQEKNSILKMRGRILDKKSVINVEAPRVNVAAPRVRVEAPVSVKPANVEFHAPGVTVNVPEQKPMDVHVHMPEVKKKLSVKRDGMGYLTGIESE